MAKDRKSDASKKDKRPKLIRDSYTIPEKEYALLAELKSRSLKLETHVKKSELLRAGLLALQNMSDSEFLQIVNSVEKLKTGRPKS